MPQGSDCIWREWSQSGFVNFFRPQRTQEDDKALSN